MRSLAFAAAAAVLLTTAQSAGSVTTSPVAEADAASVALAPTNPANPFSDPVFYPLREEAQVGCGHSNPECVRPHNFWTQILTPKGQSDTASTSTAQVRSMGAGIAHIGEANGDPCPTADSSFGTWVWVDHGGGVISRYGHLSRILITEGQLIPPGHPLGVVGATGKGSTCFRSYLDFQLRAKGVRGDDFEFPTLTACDMGARETWPAGFTAAEPGGPFGTWNAVPKGTDAPANSDDCFPTTVPATTGAPTGVALVPAGKGKLKVTWTAAPAGVDIVRLEFAKFRPNKPANKWEAQHESNWRDRGGSATGSTFSRLKSGTKYRVRVHFHTAGVGWSKSSSFVSATAR
ncbi:MAG: peptidoglycan DD-metalloendopeptidase family protein [Sporichthyaceae bacterium]